METFFPLDWSFKQNAKLSSKNRSKNGSVGLNIDEIIESFDLLEDNPVGIERFLEEIKNLNDMMERMEENMISISEFQDLILESPLDDLNLLKDYSALVDLFKTNLYTFNNTLKEFMNHEISLIKNDGKATFRIRKNQMMRTNEKFLELLTKFNGDQASYLERSEEYKNFYLKITGLNKDYEDLREAIEDGKIYDQETRDYKLHRQGSEALEKAYVWYDLADEKIKYVSQHNLYRQKSYKSFHDVSAEEREVLLKDIEARNKDILKVEAHVKELQNLFQDFSMLVESQGKFLDNIEENINKADEYIEKVPQYLNRVKNLKDTNIKLKIAAAISAVVLLFLLYFVIKLLFCLYAPEICKN